MLLDPFEEQFHLPAAFVEQRNRQGRLGEIVGDEDQSFVHLDVVVPYPAQPFGILALRQRPGQEDRLIALQAGAFVHLVRIESAELQIALGSRDELSVGLVHRVESGQVEVASIHDVEGARLDGHGVHRHVVGRFAPCNMDKTRY